MTPTTGAGKKVLSALADAFTQPAWRASYDIIRTLQERGMRTAVFGGAVRDVARFGPSYRPRDIDLVVEGASNEVLLSLFSSYVIRSTRFGGLRLNYNGYLVDIWPLQDTWAFRQGLVSDVTFQGLTRTTFLDVEAVAVVVGGTLPERMRMYEYNFLDAMHGGCVDISLKENPWPCQSLVRALLTASLLEFGIGDRLLQFAREQVASVHQDELIRIARGLYGNEPDWERIVPEWMSSLSQQASPRLHGNGATDLSRYRRVKDEAAPPG
ncbi:MAG: hypothetical protein V4671_01940 [Armatimonadota bacterium]